MIGPLAFLTTLRSSERGTGSTGFAGVVGAGACAWPCARRESASPALAARATRASSRRLGCAGGLVSGAVGPHVAHPDEAQVPQPLAALPTTFKGSGMVDRSLH